MLRQSGLAVRRKLLTVGDYILSADCAVERKTTRDFINSMFSGKLFEQSQALKDAYAKPMIILEGDIGFELEQRQNPRAFFGAMLRLELEMQVPVIPTPSTKHTADMLYTLVKRLQRKRKEEIPIQHKPRLMTERDQQIYVVASLPGIGDELAGRLLGNFKTIRKVFEAGVDDLSKVEGIGKAKAERVSKLLDLTYA